MTFVAKLCFLSFFLWKKRERRRTDDTMSPEVELSTSEKLHVSAADRRRSDREKIFRFDVFFPSNAGIN